MNWCCNGVALYDDDDDVVINLVLTCTVFLFSVSCRMAQVPDCLIRHFRPSGTSSKPSNPCRWDIGQKYPSIRDAVLPAFPIESAPCHCHPTASFSGQQSSGHQQ